MTVFQFFLINIGALIAAFGGVCLKRLSDQLDHGLPLFQLGICVLKSPYLWLGGFCYIFPIFLWTYLLKFMDLTKLQPLLSIVYIYTIFMSIVFLGESPPIMRLLGIFLIIIGVFFVGRS